MHFITYLTLGMVTMDEKIHVEKESETIVKGKKDTYYYNKIKREKDHASTKLVNGKHKVGH